MNLIEIFLLALSLSMDAFAVSICQGLALKKCKFHHMAVVGLYFGMFQFLMPIAGFSLGNHFDSLINSLDNLIPPLILGLIGGNMLKSSFDKEEVELPGHQENLPSHFVLLGLALATSLDAFSVGITFIPLAVPAFSTSLFIGFVTLICSGLGVKMGHVFGLKYKSKAEFLGGLILILMGIRIFLA